MLGDNPRIRREESVRRPIAQPRQQRFEQELVVIGRIDEHEIERALEPFGQATPAVTKADGGTGLGLPIAKGLTEALGGTLVVNSTLKRGTLVRILLPQQSRSPDALQDVAATIAEHEKNVAAWRAAEREEQSPSPAKNSDRKRFPRDCRGSRCPAHARRWLLQRQIILGVPRTF